MVGPVGLAVWVWLGGTLLLLVRTDSVFRGRVGLGTLLGPEKTPWKGFFSVPPLILLSNASRLWVWWGCVGWGVVVC